MAARRKTFKVVIVRWLDAVAHETLAEGDGCLSLSAGILVSKTRKHVKLAQIADVEPGQGDDPFRDILTIPAGMIQSIEIIPISHLPPPETGE